MAKGSKGKFDSIFMVAAVLTMGGFMYWLSVVAEPTATASAVETTEVEVAAAPPAPTVTAGAFSTTLGSYIGNPVRVEGVQVLVPLGRHVFLTEFENGTLYPIRLGLAAVAGGIVPEPGAYLTVTGSVGVMTDSVISAWTAEQIFDASTPGDLAFASPTFLQAETIEVGAPAAAAPAP